MSLGSKVAIVTGGAQGFGRAFAEQLLKRGAKVALLDIQEEKGQKTLDELAAQFGKEKVMFRKCDVTDKDELSESFHAAKSNWGTLDIVINNAGITERADWEQVVNVNANSVIRATYLAMDLMGKDKGGNGGVIINIASLAGIIPSYLFPVYCATKAAVIQFSLSCAKHPEIESKAIRLNVVAPGFAQTPLFNLSGFDEKFKEGVMTFVDMCGGIMTPEYVADHTMELIEDSTKNGQVMKLTPKLGKVYHSFAPGIEDGKL